MRSESTCRWCVLWSIVLSAVCVSAVEKANKTAIGRHPRQTEGVGLEGVWGPWSEWVECSQSCGVGVTERRRQCIAPPQTWSGTSYLPSGGSSHTPLQPPHVPYYPSSYPGNDRINPANQSPGLPLYRDIPEGVEQELPNHAPPLYRPDVGTANQQPISIYRSLSSPSSRANGQSGRGSRRPSNDGAGRVGAGGSRRSVSNNWDQASVRRPIRPGQFGYGRVPYSIPLHRQNRHALYSWLHGNVTVAPLQVKPTAVTQDAKSQGDTKDVRADTKSRKRQRQRSISKRAPPPATVPFSSPLHRPRPHLDTPPYGPPLYVQHSVVPLQHYRCSGKDREVRKCTVEACPGSPNPRAEQCAAFNNKEFMGRIYDWEPFTEGSVDQQCELICRPVGYRFYVQHSERVRDGTPCVNNTPNDVCVGGRCLSEGCDGMLGSGVVRDRCGVCGGSDGSCVRVSGSFSNNSVPLGYHKILDIPAGATAINITERSASPNYIALRSGTSQSIVNGRWAVDPPGEYKAGGTTFVYTRNPRETLTAPGPTNSLLQLYIIFHKENPGVDYEYYIPVKKDTVREWDRGSASLRETSAVVELEDSASSPISAPSLSDRWIPERPRTHNSGPNRNARIPPRTDLPLDNHSPFVWRLGQLSECSATCGKGSHRREVLCVNRHTNEEVHERRCDSSLKPAAEEELCNVHPCPPYWEAGAWSECSVSCGWGEQHRQVQCRQNFSGRSTQVLHQRCQGLIKPNTTQACHTHSCSHWQITSNWSSCSVDCGAGKRTRNVRCVSDHGDVVSDRECNTRLLPQISEDCHMGPCVSNWYISDWTDSCSVPCGPGVQKRDVVCVSNGADGECVKEKPGEMKACNSGPCVAHTHWFAGPWGQCSAPCGNGTQRRDVICVQKLGSDFSVMPASECAHLEKPSPIQTCEVEACKAQWFTTVWSACSKSCGDGVQTRDVRCLTPDKQLTSTCDSAHRPHPEQPCNPTPCNPSLDESCKDKRSNCLMVVQARLCVYTYYKTACCASCTQNAQRAKRH
ncbi:thrombospondin type-1 domain-containing protein 4 isoform X1 [Tachysurus fulvidraco]|uniref:thrombospondin type-1 domain-containing protein 4 isoform X1 n=1 Tax=Tachysurus fulvidraco TaxID=1234273 RepID=UPI001FEE4F27|nr:thrombospondin type-1 domain-containing protein 4 isoform X1 [Tachysurus fulvidraco]